MESASREQWQRPLVVHVVWHTSRDGAAPVDRLARRVFTYLCADPLNPLQRGLGIPVRLWTRHPVGGQLTADPPAEVDLSGAARNLVIVLIDDALVAADWGSYLDSLKSRIFADPGSWIIPVATTRNHLNLRLIADLSVLELQGADLEFWDQVLVNRVMHRAYRLLLDSAPPLQVFVSHAVRDGLEISHRFCEYLNRRTDLTYFISQRDIASGDQFAEVIEKAVGECALLAVLTDAYSARPWCQREVLAAKDNMLPVVVLDALSDGTARLFPYLGNAPVVRWREDSPETMEKIVGKLLDTALRRTYFPIRAAQVCGAHRLPVPDGLVWQPPELATALEHSRRVTTRDDTAAETDENRATLLYPDPPLGTDETRLLRRLVPDCEPVTLTALLASAGL